MSVEKETGGVPGHWGTLPKALVNKLEKAGFKTLEDLRSKDLAALQEIEGIGKASAEKILKEIA
jgi:DNA uptake protein ComE-like DNA-binding protein